MRGGSRPGAGRKQKVERAKKRTASFTLDEFVYDRLKQKAAEAGRSASDYLNWLLINHAGIIHEEEHILWQTGRESEWPEWEEVFKKLEEREKEREFYRRFEREYAQRRNAENARFWEQFEQACKQDQPPGAADPYGFAGLADAAAVKRRYRDLCKAHHPDSGGNHNAFVQMQAAYEDALRRCQRAS